jgi:hypothetical protein
LFGKKRSQGNARVGGKQGAKLCDSILLREVILAGFGIQNCVRNADRDDLLAYFSFLQCRAKQKFE